MSGLSRQPSPALFGLDAISVAKAREAQTEWASRSIKDRLRFVSNLRGEIARSASELTTQFSADLARTPADSLSSEIIPLLEALRFLERRAVQLLKPQRPSGLRLPFWLSGVRLTIHREPLGVILIVGPSNYPLFLVAVQTVQALVAGNAVILKPGRGSAPLARSLQLMAQASGLPQNLFQVTSEDIPNVERTLAAGVDKLVFTGSLEAGRQVFSAAAHHLTPSVMELSGRDPVLILEGSELKRAASAIAFGYKLNGGATCIAPRRIFVPRSLAASLLPLLSAQGILVDEHPEGRLTLSAYDNVEAVFRELSESPFALGATVFGPTQLAEAAALRLPAGVVVINDMIMPTADPRVPFGGRRLSGFGTTRGPQGVLEFTALKAVSVQTKARLRHLEPFPANSQSLFTAYIQARHARTPQARRAGWKAVARAIIFSAKGKSV